jgi:hypothetical protein
MIELLVDGDCAGTCTEEPVVIDVVGFQWCPEHEHKGRVINWLAAHNWPELRIGYPVVEGDKWCAVNQVLFASEDWIWTVWAYIEYLESEWNSQRAGRENRELAGIGSEVR